MKVKLKIPRAYKNKVKFTLRLFVLGVLFYIIWWIQPSFDFLKVMTAQLVSLTTGSKLILGADGVFLRKNDFMLQIITDCTGWKELFVFFSLFISWPKKKSGLKAFYGGLLILLYNLIRLDLFMLFPQTFDYFHPGFRYLSILFILFVWLWSINILKIKVGYSTKRKRKKKRSKRKKKR